MSKISKDTDNSVKRQEISPHIFMEKLQEKIGSKTYYLIRIELKLFSVLDFTVDFAGSSNVKIEGQDSLVKTTVIQPFTKVEIARLLLDKKWNIKTKFKFSLQMPSLTLQRQYLEPLELKIEQRINLNAILLKLDTASIPESQTLDFLRKKNMEFIDHEFLPLSRSIDLSEKNILEKFECLVHWRRLKEIMFSEEELAAGAELDSPVSEGILPLDIKQGKLADSWLVSAFSALAENPRLLQRVLLTKHTNKHGYFRVKLCKMSKWKVIVLDDYIPCLPLAEPIFSRNLSREFWVLILQKAFAKLYGGYSSLISGECRHALIDLTGCPTFTLNFSTAKTKQAVFGGEMWDSICEWSRLRYVLAAGTKAFQVEKTASGLIKEHAYSILKVVELDNKRFGIKYKKGEEKTCLVNLRNPWGVFEWTGDWSPESPRWTPEILEYLAVNDQQQQGSFWISWENFLENFEVLTVCKTAGWHELRIKGKFVSGVDKDYPELSHFCSRWYYEIQVKERSQVIFGIHQEDERCASVKISRPNIDMGLALVTHSDGVYKLMEFKKPDFQRERFLEVSLEPGAYYLVPQSVGVCLAFGSQHQREVTDFTDSNQLLVSVIRDIFEKYDIIANEFLSYSELQAFYEYIGKTLSPEQFEVLVNTFGRREFKDAKLEGLSEKGFINLFLSLIEDKPPAYIVSLFEKLGYDKHLYSHRSRIFTVTIHSDKPVNVAIKDGLVDNIDFTTVKLLIRKYGKSIDETTKSVNSLTQPEIEGFYYFNELFN